MKAIKNKEKIKKKPRWQETRGNVAGRKRRDKEATRFKRETKRKSGTKW